MELKLFIDNAERVNEITFNRTFMELKRLQCEQASTATSTFNRTFMELKPFEKFEDENLENF